MTQTFSNTDEPWSRLSGFTHDGVEVSIMPYAGSDHSAATTVFTTKSDSDVFHADKYCHRLHQSEPYVIDGTPKRTIEARTLETVLTSWLSPVRPCDYCTLDIHTTVEVAEEYDGVPEEVMKYYEPGDECVTEQWSRDSDGSWELTRQSKTEVY